MAWVGTHGKEGQIRDREHENWGEYVDAEREESYVLMFGSHLIEREDSPEISRVDWLNQSNLNHQL